MARAMVVMVIMADLMAVMFVSLRSERRKRTQPNAQTQSGQ
jgi:hypothetical protein